LQAGGSTGRNNESWRLGTGTFSRLLKKGTGSEPMAVNAAKNGRCEVPVPLLQRPVSRWAYPRLNILQVLGKPGSKVLRIELDGAAPPPRGIHAGARRQTCLILDRNVYQFYQVDHVG